MKSIFFGSIGSLVECSEIQRKAFNLAFKEYGLDWYWNIAKKPSEMRVIDMYRREGDKLTENWVFIDLLHFWKILGVDILKSLK